jgi:D-3-phosphoglycerate dehydrogenase
MANLDCLAAALRSGHLYCAALDVLPSEPPKEHPLLTAWRKDDPWLAGWLIINPHAAYYSQRGWFEMRYKAAETARLYLVQNRLRNHIVPGNPR